MQALILAAGMGKRLKDLTQHNTKCMVKVNGVTLIERMLNQIEQYSFSKIIIVIGYEGNKLREYIRSLNIKTPIEFVVNPIYDKTNNIYSLSLASDYLIKDDTVLFESDLIFEDSVLSCLVNDTRSNLALVDKYESWMDGTCVLLSSDDSIESFIPGKSVDFSKTKDYYKTVNIYKFSKDFSLNYYVPFLTAYQKALGENEYYEQVLRVITMLDNSPIKAKRLEGHKWYEIDDIQDLDIAESIFTQNAEEKLSKLQLRKGGYWRYPKLIDFSNLVNPYFPTTRLTNEIKANFETLLTHSPSGLEVNCLLAAKNFDVPQDCVVVSNDIEELVNNLLLNFENKKVGVICSCFKEILKSCKNKTSIKFDVFNKDTQFNVDDVISYYSDKDIVAILLRNPDSYLGNYIHKNDIKKMIIWAKQKSIKVIIDESFVDFVDEEVPSLIEKNYLKEHSHVYIVKSLKYTHGIPGLSLGLLISFDIDSISRIKSFHSNCSVNSFAEFYMQIYEKYKSEYKLSLELLKKEKRRFFEGLSKFHQLKVISSQTNFFIIRIDEHIDSKTLLNSLLTKHNILVNRFILNIDKNHFLKLAIRSSEDNDKMLAALSLELL